MPTHVFIIIGQSNAVGRSLDDAGAYYPAGTLNYTTAGAWAAISKRVLHGSVEAAANDTTFAFDRQFAIDYVAANPGVTLAFIGAAEGGTGFAAGDWIKGGATYDRAVARINAALTSVTGGAVLKGFLWHQGEADGQNTTAADAYAARLSTFIDDFRGDITGGAAVPFVLGGIPNQSNQFNSKVHTAVMAMRNSKLLSGYAAVDVGVEDGFNGDGVHLNAAAQRALGSQYALAYVEAAANTDLGGGGTVTLGTPVTGNFGSGTVLTATDVSLGDTASDRLMLVGITARNSSFQARVKFGTLAGVTLKRIVAAALISGGNNTVWYYARIPTGTTGILSVTTSGSVSSGQGAYTIIPAYNARDPVANLKSFGWNAGGNSYGTSISADLDVQAGEVLIAQASAMNATLPSGSLNLATQVGRAIGANVYNIYGIEQITADATKTVTATFGATVNNPSVVGFTLKPAGVAAMGVSGSGASEIALSGAATASVAVTGAAAGTIALTGAGAGVMRLTGAAGGVLDLTGSGLGAVAIKGLGGGTITLTGTAAGSQVGGVTGAGNGNLPLAGSGTGKATIAGAGQATLALDATGAGRVAVRGIAAGIVDLSGAGTGSLQSGTLGAGQGSIALGGAAQGSVRVMGAAAGFIALTGQGASEAISPVLGAAAGIIDLSGAGAGKVFVRGTAASIFAITGQGSQAPLINWERLLGTHMPKSIIADARPVKLWVTA